MSQSNDILQVLLTEEQLKAKCAEMGAQITKDYQGKNLLLVTVLKGAVVYLADLMRCIDLPCAIDILIVEDILDSGMTLSYLKGLLQGRNPASIRIATLLDKPSRRKVDLQADYVGYEVPDEFVVGYGLDYDEKYRNLPYVGILKPEVYTK